MTEPVISAFLIFGAFFVLLGSLGLVKFPDTYARLHAPTKATTLGLGAILVGSSIWTWQKTGTFSAHEVLVTLFLFLTAPISAYLISRAALHLRIEAGTKLPKE